MWLAAAQNLLRVDSRSAGGSEAIRVTFRSSPGRSLARLDEAKERLTSPARASLIDFFRRLHSSQSNVEWEGGPGGDELTLRLEGQPIWQGDIRSAFDGLRRELGLDRSF